MESEREVSEEQIQAFLDKNPNMIYFPTSAKETTRVEKAFDEIARQSIANKSKRMYFVNNLALSLFVSQPEN